MLALKQLEIHVAHSCNLTCESCAHYSNQGHKGFVPIDVADGWMKAWTSRIIPEFFNLVGGEPSLHSQLTSFVRLARRHWPHAKTRLISNGFFLHRHPALADALRETDTLLAVSVHHASPEYQARFESVRVLAERWARDQGVRVEFWNAVGRWTRRYRGIGAAMQPFEDGQPRQSWEICPARFSMQLFGGKLWKCPALTYLGMQHERYGLGDQWKPYLAYRPLASTCTEQELAEFLALEEEPFCGMCPAKPEPFEPASPLISLGRIRAAQAA